MATNAKKMDRTLESDAVQVTHLFEDVEKMKPAEHEPQIGPVDPCWHRRVSALQLTIF